MIKVIIAEDEEFDLRALIKEIDWQEIGVELVGTASDGQKALDMISKLQPDIILTDIEMPIKNGIQVAMEVSKHFPNIRIIFLSGHQKFNYAKAGIECNIEGYLIKPFEKDQLNNLINETAKKCIAEKNRKLENDKFQSQLKESLPLLKDKFFRDLLFADKIDERKILDRAEYLGINMDFEVMASMYIELDDYEADHNNRDESSAQLLHFRISNAIEEMLEEYNFKKVILLNESHYALLIDIGNMEDYKSITNVLAARIKKNVNIFTNQSVTLGIGGCTNQLFEIPNIFRKAIEALRYKFYLGKNEVIFFDDFVESGTPQLPNTEKIISNIMHDLKTGNEEHVIQLLDDLFLKLAENINVTDSYTRSLCYQIIGNASIALLEINESMNAVFDDEAAVMTKLMNYRTIPDISLWMKQIFGFICRYLSENKKNKNSRIADRVKEIINEKYYMELTNEYLSREVFLSAGYMMNLFKKETGDSINHYIIKVRIKKAMEFLKEENAKVYEVAERVGYKNLTYFSSAFKNFVGMSPKDYRENILK